jgi:hypothetical protein
MKLFCRKISQGRTYLSVLVTGKWMVDESYSYSILFGANDIQFMICISDGDSDCMKGLKCFQRNAYEHVPGCVNRGTQRTDYCYDPYATDTLATVGNDGLPKYAYPFGKCEGDW